MLRTMLSFWHRQRGSTSVEIFNQVNKRSGETPLIAAVRNGDLETVKFLLSPGVRSNALGIGN